MKAPWVKLWRTTSTDEKLRFLVRRYGHECMTYWVALLTQCDDGVLTLEDEIMADLCIIEDSRFQELKGIFVKYGLIEVSGAQTLLPKWDEYQLSESTERVRAYRERKKAEALQKRPCNGDVTVDGDVDREGEEEKEKENSPGHEPKPETPEGSPLDYRNPVEHATGPNDPRSGASKLPPAAIAWYKRYSSTTSRLIAPDSRDYQKASDLAVKHGLDPSAPLPGLDLAIEEYFTHWDELWFARTGEKGSYRPAYNFGNFALHFDEILDAAQARKPSPSARQKERLICPACGAEVVGTLRHCPACGLETKDFKDDAKVEEARAWKDARDRGEPEVPDLMAEMRKRTGGE